MKTMIVLTALVLATGSAFAADEKSKVIVAKATMTVSKTALATDSSVCDYSVESNCR
jgi:hypothetical protein